MKNKEIESKRKPGLVRIGLFNFLLRLAISPLSFVFSLLMAKYLSDISSVTFGAWQTMFVLITGYFVIPADIFSNITSRYAAEGKKVGGILLINGIAGALGISIYLSIIPFITPLLGGNFAKYFYFSSILVFLFYIFYITRSIALGRSPRVSAISASIFQIIRLLSGIILMFIFNLSIYAVILAYSLGYIAQILINVLFTNANLQIDLKIAFKAIKKSIVFITSYIQNIIEASLVWIAVYLVRTSEPVSYFESALIIANIIMWSSSITDGLILKLAEKKDPYLLETATKLFFLAGSFFLVLTFVDGDPLLFILRHEYIEAFFALIVLSISNFFRSLYTIFYRGIYMADTTLSTEGSGELKGITANLIGKNIFISTIGLAFSTLLMIILRNFNFSYPALAIAITLGLLINSIGMLITAYVSAKNIYGLIFPKIESIVPLISAVISSLPFLIQYIEGNLPKFRAVHEIEIMLIYTLISSSIFVTINIALNPYARQLFIIIIKRIKNL